MADSPLDDAIARYREKLRALEASHFTYRLSYKVLRVFLARDRVADLQTEDAISTQLSVRLARFDERLKHQAWKIRWSTRDFKWKHWASAKAERWWWQLLASPSLQDYGIVFWLYGIAYLQVFLTLLFLQFIRIINWVYNHFVRFQGLFRYLQTVWNLIADIFHRLQPFRQRLSVTTQNLTRFCYSVFVWLFTFLNPIYKLLRV
jgi:hypothetical protein